MPLSADGVLGFFNGTGRRYEAFEHVSLALPIAAAVADHPSSPSGGAAVQATAVSPTSTPTPTYRCKGTPVLENRRAEWSGQTAVTAKAIPVATAVLSAAPPLSLASAGSAAVTETKGTLYLCELPETMWASVAAVVTATSAPSQRQFAFSSEAPAFCSSANPSFVWGGEGGAEKRTGQPSAATPSDNKGSRSADAQAGGGGAAAATQQHQQQQQQQEPSAFGVAESSGVFDAHTPPRQSRTAQLGLPDRLPSPAPAGHEVDKGIHLPGAVTAAQQPVSPCIPLPQAARGAATPPETVGSGTVTIALWVAADAASDGTAVDADAGTAGSSLAAIAAASQKTSAHADPCTSFKGTAMMPRCLCFAVRDITRAESSDTDVVTTRERRLQRLTVALGASARYYAAKTTSAVLEDAVSQPGSASSSVTDSHAPAPSTRLTGPPQPAISFVFYQGGIARCVAALKRHYPSLIYERVAVRSSANSSPNNSSSAHLCGGDPTPAGPTPSSTAPYRSTGEASGGWLQQAGRGSGYSGSAALSGGAAKQAATPFYSPTEQSSKAGGGWRSRLAAAGLFGHGKAPHNPSSSPTTQAKSPLHPSSPSFFGAATAKGRGGGEQRKGGRNTSAGAAHGGGGGVPYEKDDSDTAAGGQSSNSSFEDLTDEMTAVRLGACYVPPKPSLPPVSPDSSASGGGPPLSATEWASVFDDNAAAPDGSGGRVLNRARWAAFRQSLFERGGLADASVRYEVWCYLLGAFPVGSTAAEQAAIMEKETSLYARLTSQWTSFLPEQEEHFTAYRYAKHSILKDVERTDRTHPAFRDDDSDMLRVLRELLLAHVMLNMDLGYSQGMSDVAAIASLVAPAPPAGEPAMFLCLRKMLSEHMATSFVIEERKKDAPYAAVKGLQRKLYQVQVLTRHFNPRLYEHLRLRCMAEDMTFCFRWLLVCFKRDLGSLADTMRFWDVLFACPYTKSYEVVVTVALLVALAPQITTHIHAYETLLQFMNALSSGTSLDQLLQCARDFYENMCVVETRELRRWRRSALAAAGADTTMVRGTRMEPHSAASCAKPSSAPPAVVGQVVDEDDRHYFPTVEEMVLLFLEMDGPV